ncbi:hypothetical protein DAT606_0368 [Melissococcus plutonius]|uniref:Uncharacterized protein n=1 Tax=Melissococcus plutonius TaxID=33970 RepID=A0A2Z5Y3D8_9ENTE|nr:hypothetical protein DAT561_1241 [Melissococcus plutonius]BBD14973.1 hypothetical protein DAT585_0613 [Melissococcus plutonius]BBD16410.1 hypothetical protein DAT606_0368 [Melissococcus plutonius]BBP06965.1 hypothetical protein DAT1033_0368 [Melissococcus plutonius]
MNNLDKNRSFMQWSLDQNKILQFISLFQIFFPSKNLNNFLVLRFL